jgi:hypothetical protein
LVEVDIVHAKPAQAVVDFGEDRLARQPSAVGAGTHPAIDLGGDDHLVAAGEILDRAAENFLAAAERIAVGGVEEIDAGFERLLDERAAFFLAEAPGMVALVAAAIAMQPRQTRDTSRPVRPSLVYCITEPYPWRNGEGEARKAANSSA